MRGVGAMDTSNDITMKFGAAFSGVDLGPLLLEVERLARRMTSVRAEVFLERKGDDSKLRVMMTPEERKKL